MNYELRIMNTYDIKNLKSTDYGLLTVSSLRTTDFGLLTLKTL